MPFGKLVVGTGIEVGIGHRPQQYLELDRRCALVFGHQCDHGCHVAADAVAGHGQAFAIDVDLFTVLGHPFGRGVSLVDRHRVMRFRRRCVIDENRCCTRTDNQVTNQSFVGREVPQYPATTVEEHEHRQLVLDPGRPDDSQAQRLAVDLNGLLADIGFRQRQLDPGLRTHQHGAGIGRCHLLHRFAGAGIQHIKECLGVVFNVAGKCTVDGQSEKGTGQDFAESVHVHFLFGPEWL
ncbi:hypothetical protein D3C81_992170 [compost metagenome]